MKKPRQAPLKEIEGLGVSTSSETQRLACEPYLQSTLNGSSQNVSDPLRNVSDDCGSDGSGSEQKQNDDNDGAFVAILSKRKTGLKGTYSKRRKKAKPARSESGQRPDNPSSKGGKKTRATDKPPLDDWEKADGMLQGGMGKDLGIHDVCQRGESIPYQLFAEIKPLCFRWRMNLLSQSL
jgi:hypothetical protein